MSSLVAERPTPSFSLMRPSCSSSSRARASLVPCSIKVGASPAPHAEILEVAQKILEKAKGAAATVRGMMVAVVPTLVPRIRRERGKTMTIRIRKGTERSRLMARFKKMRGYGRHQIVVMYAAVIILVILVQIIQSIGTALSVKSDRRIN